MTIENQNLNQDTQEVALEQLSDKANIDQEKEISDQENVSQDEIQKPDEDLNDKSSEEDEENTESELEVKIGDEVITEEKKQSDIKSLRNAYKELKKQFKELQYKSVATNETVDASLVEPTLDGCAYDEEKYRSELKKWFDKKQEQEKATVAWQQKLNAYQDAKSQLDIDDFDEIEESFAAAFNVTQQSLVVQCAKNPAHIVLALGKNTEKSKEFRDRLAKITNPVEFAYEIGKLEKDLSVTKKIKSPPTPEKLVKAKSGASIGTIDGAVEEAMRTGDCSQLKKHFLRRNE